MKFFKLILPKKKSKLSNLLFRNYILSYLLTTFILTITLIILIIFGASMYLDDYYIIDNYLSENIPAFLKNDYSNLHTIPIEEAGGYVEIVNNSGDIVYSKGKTPNNRTSYSLTDFNAVLSGNYYDDPSSQFSYKTFYNGTDNLLLVIAIPKSHYTGLMNSYKLKPSYFIVISAILSFFIFLISFIIYSKSSSKAFIKPLRALMEGVKKISTGDYSTRIYLKSNNEFGQLSDSFNNMAKKIQEEQKLKENSENIRKKLILDISHDLKNPLANILGYSEYILNNPNISQDEKDKYLVIINNNSIRANSLIQDLFNFSKLQSEDFKLNFKQTDICEFLREVIASYISEIEEKNFNYVFDIPDKSFYVNIDENHLIRAIGNLISNSLKYNSEGTVLIIKGFSLDKKFIIKIKDNGIGIPKELKENIFNPFVKVDVSRNSKNGGSGIGLSITKDIIEKHNGSISLECGLNEGAEFSIYLPLT